MSWRREPHNAPPIVTVCIYSIINQWWRSRCNNQKSNPR
nr:MAG TPA: toxin [Caudoviricetes sp.]